MGRGPLTPLLPLGTPRARSPPPHGRNMSTRRRLLRPGRRRGPALASRASCRCRRASESSRSSSGPSDDASASSGPGPATGPARPCHALPAPGPSARIPPAAQRCLGARPRAGPRGAAAPRPCPHGRPLRVLAGAAGQLRRVRRGACEQKGGRVGGSGSARDKTGGRTGRAGRAPPWGVLAPHGEGAGRGGRSAAGLAAPARGPARAGSERAG